jgi:8-oxo-dGTP diphosphatase
VWRGKPWEPELAVIHRPRYDDWTLPKGKLKPPETLLDAAVREVTEELSVAVAVSRRLGMVRYPIDGSRKTVTYWLMRHRAGTFEPNDEVDEVAWLAPRQARNMLSYGTERAVVSDFLSVPVPEAVVVLVRHAKAGHRSQWSGDDMLRPLEPSGEQQATRLVQVLGYFAPQRIISADPLRCVQTVEPLAQECGLPVEVDPTFADDNLRTGFTAGQLLALAKPGSVTVVCSQGVTIPALVAALAPGDLATDTRKAAAWVLSVVDGDVISADYVDDALH